MTIKDNIFSQNGYISEETTTLVLSQVEMPAGRNFPYEAYIASRIQAHGVFAFYFDRFATTETHLISGNVFTHNFCLEGCAYYAEGQMSQQLRFENNTYSYMVASGGDGGSVFLRRALTSVTPSDIKEPFIHFFIGEKVSNTVGGALALNGLNN